MESARPIRGYDILETVPGTMAVPGPHKGMQERTFVEGLSATGKIGVYADVPLMFSPRRHLSVIQDRPSEFARAR